MIASLDEIVSFVIEKNTEAQAGATLIKFAEPMSAHGTNWLRAESPSLTDLPKCGELLHGCGMGAWSVVLAVDMRNSSKIAEKIKANNMYVTMHTYLPTMARLVELAGGKVANLRGDGLFAVFGMTELVGTGKEVTQDVSDDAARNSVRCGKAMIEAMQDAINPVLKRNGIDEWLEIGVGISVGNVVVTRVGYDSANEVTLYGSPVNQACKELAAANHNEVRVTQGLRQIFPTGKGGRITFNRFKSWYSVSFPSDTYMLERPMRKAPK